MIDDNLRLRAKRLLSGQHRVEDLDRLFLDQRDRHHGKASFREIGNFVAHRKERQQGLVTEVARDVFTSVSVWSLGFRRKKPTTADIVRVAWANYRLASDRQVMQGCGLRRIIAKRRLKAGLAKFERGETLTDQEVEVIAYFGNRFIWKPAFTDDQLFDEFRDVLLGNAIISKADVAALATTKAFITLYAITCMHGSTIRFEGDATGELLAGFANKDRHLEVKVQIRFDDVSKPIFSPVCMFLTSIQPEGHCEPALLELGSEWQAHVWPDPIELNPEGRLALIG